MQDLRLRLRHRYVNENVMVQRASQRCESVQGSDSSRSCKEGKLTLVNSFFLTEEASGGQTDFTDPNTRLEQFFFFLYSTLSVNPGWIVLRN